jgi:iron-sulfur cluster assembly accessory protein
MDLTMTQPGFNVSERAARRIAEIAPAGAPLFRVTVEGGGCSGFQYRFDMVNDREEDDVVIERCGATVLVDAMSAEYLAGGELDFVDDLMGQRFQVTNPNAASSCGCGTSFAL